jgi:selenocysteine-specific elongation factor
MFVIGTAGHVDHGKTTLIKSLTGIDPDRLKEEKERQMTIDLGFAWLKLPSGVEVGIVDVPGHQDFIDNMLAGAGGIDAVLFVIAADEGIMPQTREHLSILDLLEIKHGLIVLTKIDLVPDKEWLELIENDIREFLKGSFLSDSPIIEVSAFTGKGLNELTQSIDDMLKKCSPKLDRQRARLPVDRVFSLKGFGTIVTGTLLDGQFSVGQQAEILPIKIQTRIRNIQSHKKKVEIAYPGSRIALNLIGVNVSEIERGNVVAKIGAYSGTRRVDARFSSLKNIDRNLLHNDTVKFYSGTSQTLARVRLIGSENILPGEKGWVQLELKNEIVVSKGDHFILRLPSSGKTLGGGVILEEHPIRRVKRFAKITLEQFHLLESGNIREILLDQLKDGNPKTLDELSEKTGFTFESVKKSVMDMLVKDLELLEIRNDNISGSSLLTTKTALKNIEESMIEIVSEYHKKFPLRLGITKDELRRKVNLIPHLFGLILEIMISQNQLNKQGDLISLPGYKPEFSKSDLKIVECLFQKMDETPYSPPTITDLNNEFGEEIVQALITKGQLKKTSDDIAFKRQYYDLMLSNLMEFLKVHGSIALNQFRDMFQTSRKYSLSFLEYLDQENITIREGDRRVLRTIDKE